MTCLRCMPAGQTELKSIVMYSKKGIFIHVAICVTNSVAASLPTTLTVLSSVEALPVSCESS